MEGSLEKPMRTRWRPSSTLPTHKKKQITIEDVDIGDFIAQVSTHKEEYSLRFSSNYGLGVDWLISNGKVFVGSFSPLITFDNYSLEESGYVIGPVEAGGLVHVGDRLIRVNHTVLDTLDLVKIPDVVKMINTLAEVNIKSRYHIKGQLLSFNLLVFSTIYDIFIE